MTIIKNFSSPSMIDQHIEGPSRREILRGGAFVLGMALLGCGKPEETLTAPVVNATTLSGELESLNLFVSIRDSGDVQIMCHRAEMGQHARTGLARVIADELEADWNRVSVMQAEGEAKYGDQNTDGSTTIRADFMRLRRIGASARSMLEGAAAQLWEVPVGDCKAIMHEVVHGPSGRRVGYGALAGRASAMEVPAYEGDDNEEFNGEQYRLKTPAEWRYIGKATSTIDMDDLLTGKAVFGQDVTLPDMKIAVIARPPVLFGKVKSFNKVAAMQVPGVKHVLPLPNSARDTPSNKGGFNPLGGIAVIADNTWAAIQGRNALEATWDNGPNADFNSVDYRAEIEASVRQPQKVIRSKGDVDTAISGASRTVSADYYVPHLAHAQMEPPAALASFKDGKMEIWTSTQNPQQARTDLVEILGIEYGDIRVNNALLGGAFGRKSKPDFVYEAALLSRELEIPVKVIWTREDDIKHDYLHTVSAQHLDAALDDQGNVTAWRQRVTFPSISTTFNPAAEYGSDGELGLGLIDNPFAIENMQFENGKAKGHIRIGWLRSVNNIQHAFAAQSFAAELAHEAGRDPKDFLLELIGPDRIIDLTKEGLVADYSNYGQPYDDYPIDTGRLKNVIEVAAKGLGWRSSLATSSGGGHGIGIAAHRSFLTYVATAVEVKVSDNGEMVIENVHVACDCGVAVNPESVKAQMEGGSIFALSNALDSAVTLSNGQVEQNNFYDYELLRIHRAPRQINVTLVESDAAPGGAGEPGTPPFVPALTNAIFAATGKRIRALPIAGQLRS